MQSFFTYESVVADHSSMQVTNGRHRMYAAWHASAPHLPVQSKRVSDWSHSLFGNPDHTSLQAQTFSCAYLIAFAGVCRACQMREDLDRDFVGGLGAAVDVAEQLLDVIAADAAKIDPTPRVLERI